MASTTIQLAVCLASLLLVSHLAAAQPTPTEMLNAQRQQQAQQQSVQQQQEQRRRVATRRLPAPCVVPDSYYPFSTCKVSSSPGECGKGFNAWASFADCCRPGNASFYPERYCGSTSNLTRCSFNWGQWSSEDECCAPGRGFPEGCTVPDPCWVATEWSPQRKCGTSNERATCTRGWATYTTERDCCAPNAAFAEGCGGGFDAAETPSAEYEPAMAALLAEQRAMLNPQEVQAFAAVP